MKEIRRILASQVEDAVCKLFVDANHRLPEDVVCALCTARDKETAPLAKDALGRICDNMAISAKRDLPLCQDTGMAVVFVQLGDCVVIENGSLNEAIQKGVARAYRDGGMRCSIVKDPLYARVNTEDNTPAIIHLELVAGDTLTITAVPKGFGSENTAALRMLTPSAGEDDIVAFVVETVKRAGGNPCPPIVIGIGLGSDFEGVAMLAKKALLCPLDANNDDPAYARLERRILEVVNESGVGAQGFGGVTTALAVHILTAPTHIAGLPCAVNINCHVARHASVTI